MNRQQIEKLAREADIDFMNGLRDDNTHGIYFECWPEQLEHFARLVRAAALEEAKEACMHDSPYVFDKALGFCIRGPKDYADAIEALKVKP